MNRILLYGIGSMMTALIFCCAPNKTKTTALFPIWENGKWGYINNEGKTVITPQFDFASPFHEGMAAIYQDSLWGFIDETGKQVIKPQKWEGGYSEYPRFQDGVCQLWISIEGKSYKTFINRKGDRLFVVPKGSYFYSSFADGRARVETEDSVIGYANKSGNIVIKSQSWRDGSFSEGIAQIRKGDSTQYIDTTGTVIIAFSSTESSNFHEGLAYVSSNEEHFYIDKTGKQVIKQLSPEYGYADFHEGLAKISINGTYQSGYIDRTGAIVIPPQYEHAEDFSDGLAEFRTTNGWGFLNTKGEIQIEPTFDQIISKFHNGLCLVQKNNQRGYINKQGKFVWREQTDLPYTKIDRTQWKLDTLEINKPLLADYFDLYQNPPRPTSDSLPTGMALHVDTTSVTVFFNKYLAYTIRLTNGSNDTTRIIAADGTIDITQQALNKNGTWENLTSFGLLFCGNSFQGYDFPPNHHVIFPATFFKGSFKTKLRFVFRPFLYKKSLTTIYSNEFDGMINLGQFMPPNPYILDLISFQNPVEYLQQVY